MQKCKTETETKGKAAARSRWHEVILYPDDLDTENIKARASAGWEEWAGILHDLDVDKSTGELIKPHYHLLLHSSNGRALSAVAKALRVPESKVEIVSNGEAALAYLTHSTDAARKEGKHLYPAAGLEGPLAPQAAAAAARAAGTASEGSQVVAILEHIAAIPETERITMAELARWAAASGLWASFRRAAIIFKTVMEEHNETAAAAAAARARAAAVKNDPGRFTRLRAGEEEAPAASVDMDALKAVSG